MKCLMLHLFNSWLVMLAYETEVDSEILDDHN